MNILVIGSNGMLGHTTILYLRMSGYDVDGISKSSPILPNTIQKDILDAQFFSEIDLQKYDLIINCAALLVKPSEKNKCGAILVNSFFPHQLEEKLKYSRIKIIQVSTCGVFSGFHAPYKENSIPDSTTFYGKSKSLGELTNDKDLTIRGNFFGPDLLENGTGLFNWFVSQNGSINGYNNEFMNAVTSLEFAKFVASILENDMSGICHIGAAETISKGNLLEHVKKEFSLDHIRINGYSRADTLDFSLLSTRKDQDYQPKRYDLMLKELHEWMVYNKIYYKHYNNKIIF